jgi:hypothetical protein
MVKPIWTHWALGNEPEKMALIKHIADMAKNKGAVDHARERAKEIAKEWPEFLWLLKQELEK